MAPETHDAYLKEFINHFYKNVLKLIDRWAADVDEGAISTEHSSSELRLSGPMLIGRKLHLTKDT